jgi:hypothetical protein
MVSREREIIKLDAENKRGKGSFNAILSFIYQSPMYLFITTTQSVCG